MKTSQLTGEALDWAVAKCECILVEKSEDGKLTINSQWDYWFPSCDWSQGGVIIEREKIELAYRPQGDLRSLHSSRKPDWAAGIYNTTKYTTDHICSGETPLIAAMRCYVASKLGDEIEVPSEMLDLAHES